LVIEKSKKLLLPDAKNEYDTLLFCHQIGGIDEWF
jgi:hypothetical protein